jgi:glutathione S-transferase
MKIYGSPLSPFVARIILACDHKGIDHSVEMPEGGLKTPEYLALNPFGKIPTVKIGKTVLYESGVILSYLDDTHGKKAIIPKSANGAARARLIATISELYVQDPALQLFRQLMGRSPKDPAAAKDLVAKLEQGLDVLNMYISPGPCAGGKGFTIADCYVAPALVFVDAVAAKFGVKDVYKGRANVKKYWAAIKKHKSAKRQIGEMLKLMKDRLKAM